MCMGICMSVCVVHVHESVSERILPLRHLPTPVHQALMETWNFLGCKFTLTMACQSAKGLSGTFRAHTHKL